MHKHGAILLLALTVAQAGAGGQPGLPTDRLGPGGRHAADSLLRRPG